jgi:hypothetical protein
MPLGGSQNAQDFILGWPPSKRDLCNGTRRIDRAFSPHRCLWSPETQADGLGWYGVALSVLGFAANRAVRIQSSKKLIWTRVGLNSPGT